MKYKTDDVIAALRDSRGMVYVAARVLDCSPQTIYNYAIRFKSVQAAIDAERGYAVDLAETKLFDAAAAGEAWAVKFILRMLGKNRGYVPVEKQEVQSTNIEVSMNDLTEAELRKLASGGSL